MRTLQPPNLHRVRPPKTHWRRHKPRLPTKYAEPWAIDWGESQQRCATLMCSRCTSAHGLPTAICGGRTLAAYGTDVAATAEPVAIAEPMTACESPKVGLPVKLCRPH